MGNVFEVNTDFVRGVATWAAVTKLGKDFPAMCGVNFTVTDDDGGVDVTVTDRFRIVYARHDSAALTGTMGDSFTIPMELFTRFVAATKGVDGGATVRIECDDDGGVVLSNHSNRVVGDVIRGQYPKVAGLFKEWVAADSAGVGEVFMPMGLLADVVKFANPHSRSVTAARMPKGWRMRFGVPRETGKVAPMMFDLGDNSRFGVLVQPRTSLGV